jgi:membrane-bound serine protease (ClpP class)
MQRYRSRIGGRPLRTLAAFVPLAALLGLGIGGALAQEEARPSSAGLVYRIPVTGVVELGLAPFISRSLDEAAEAGAVAAVLDIDTPGGRVDAAQQIADALGDARIPVYAYVNRRALSAGALIALATDRIYMRPGSSLGAATPVTGEGEKASEKMVSAMRSEFRALAEAAGLDPRVAEAMVDEDIAIEGLDPAGKLLTLSTADAVRIGYAQEVADWDALLATIGATGAAAVDTRPNWAEGIVRFLTHPLVSPFLLSLGFLGLLIEIKTPTFGLAGLAGLTSLGLFFGSHLLVGLAGWEALILLGVGVVLLLVEAFVLPGFGVAGVAGILAIVVSILLSLVGEMPTMGDMMVAMQVLGMSALIVGFVGWQLIKRLPDDRRAHRLFLSESLTRELGYRSAPSRDDLVGAEGVALTDLRPAGAARFGEESVDVVSSGAWVKAGTPIRIVQEEGYRHVVEPL